MLMHKADSWASALIMYTFSKFARVRTFKPTKKHQTRSSFYMIAQDVQPDHEFAKAALQEWKDTWWRATFGGKNGTGEMPEEPTDGFVHYVIEQFGKQLIEMGRDVWRIQADALSKTEYGGTERRDLATS